jgi:Helicase associated domain
VSSTSIEDTVAHHCNHIHNSCCSPSSLLKQVSGNLSTTILTCMFGVQRYLVLSVGGGETRRVQGSSSLFHLYLISGCQSAQRLVTAMPTTTHIASCFNIWKASFRLAILSMLLFSAQGFIPPQRAQVASLPISRLKLGNTATSVKSTISAPASESIDRHQSDKGQQSITSPISSTDAPNKANAQEARQTQQNAHMHRENPWMLRVHELDNYRQVHGHCCVPKRYLLNPSLGNWVNKQRQEYKRYIRHEKPCALTQERIDILNKMGFCWDTTNTKSKHTDNNTQRVHDRLVDTWWETFHALQCALQQQRVTVMGLLYPSVGADCESSSRSAPPSLHDAYSHTDFAKWLQKQRQSTHELDASQLQALDSLDPRWRWTSRQVNWEHKYKQLEAYLDDHGHVNVPISYATDPSLAHWVSNQRKQYTLRQKGLPSAMTNDRIHKLNKIGFVWNRWDYEFGNHLG